MMTSSQINGTAEGGVHSHPHLDMDDVNEAATARAQGSDERDIERIKQILHSMGVHRYGKLKIPHNSQQHSTVTEAYYASCMSRRTSCLC
jgi:hypothetical protein